MRNLTRRSFIGAAGAAAMAVAGSAALTGCGGSSASDSGSGKKEETEEEAFMKEGKGQHLVCAVTGKLIKIAPAIIADRKGYFKEEGCDIEFQTIALADAMASMSIDKLDVDLFGIVPAASYISQGSEIYIIGGTVLNGGEYLTKESFDKDLTKVDSFRGLNIACSREETGQMWLKNYLQDQGLDLEKDVTFTYVDNSTTALEGLRSGQNDVFIIPNAMGYTLGRDGIKVAGHVNETVGRDYPCCRHNVSANAFKTKFLSLVDMETAIIRGYAYMQDPANKQEVIDMMVDYSAQQPDYVEASFWGKGDYKVNQVLSPDPYVNACKEFYEAVKKIGEIDANTPYTMDDYATPVVYRKALDNCLSKEPDNEIFKKLDSEYSAHNE